MKNSEIHVIYGSNPAQMAYDLLEKIELAKELNPGMSVGIKPNLVVAKKASEGATTTPEIVESVIRYLQDHKIHNIAIMESSWVGDNTKRAFKVCGYEKLSEKYNVPLYDLKDDDVVVKQVAGLSIKVCKRPLAVDFLINIPVLKAHCQTLMTCSLKNMKGCIPDSEKRHFHSLGLNKPIGYLGKILKADLIIVDSIAGDLTFEEGGNPVQMGRIMVGKDPVLMDTYGASLLGYSKEDIEYIEIAERAGVGSADLHAAQIVEYDIGLKNGTQFRPSNKVRRLAQKVVAKESCSACYGTLIHALQRLDEKQQLKFLRQPIYIGQGFRGQVIEGLGIGQCTKQCSHFVPGCPPTGKNIVDFLEKHLHK
ncbi:MAG: DUF362 domain-containing protein [Veillonellales bacterium]